MSKTSPFLVSDIGNISIKIKIADDQTDNLKKIAKTLSVADFKTVSTKVFSFFDFVDSHVPVLLLSGKGFDISLMRTGIVLSFLGGGQIIQVSEMSKDLKNLKKEELFSKDTLSKIDSDFNFVIGLILGKLGIELENLSIDVSMFVSKNGKLKNDFTHLFTNESKTLLGKISDVHIKEAGFHFEEELFGTKTKSMYDIDEISDDENTYSVRCRLNLEFKHTVPLNTFKFIESTLLRVNTLIESLVGGIVV